MFLVYFLNKQITFFSFTTVIITTKMAYFYKEDPDEDPELYE